MNRRTILPAGRALFVRPDPAGDDCAPDPGIHDRPRPVPTVEITPLASVAVDEYAAAWPQERPHCSPFTLRQAAGLSELIQAVNQLLFVRVPAACLPRYPDRGLGCQVPVGRVRQAAVPGLALRTDLADHALRP
jgi:hypothetical protein